MDRLRPFGYFVPHASSVENMERFIKTKNKTELTALVAELPGHTELRRTAIVKDTITTLKGSANYKYAGTLNITIIR